MKAFFLKTERLGFSTWSMDDLGLAASLWGDENVTRYICAAGKFTEQDILSRLMSEINTEEDFGVQYWPFFDLKSNDFIGCCGLRPYDPDQKVYEIGFHLRKIHWGKGYATEAAEAVIDYAFKTLHVNDLFAGHHPNNQTSKKVLERLGFHYIGEEYYEPTGLYHPSYKYK